MGGKIRWLTRIFAIVNSVIKSQNLLRMKKQTSVEFQKPMFPAWDILHHHCTPGNGNNNGGDGGGGGGGDDPDDEEKPGTDRPDGM